MLLFLPAHARSVEAELASTPGLSTAIMSAPEDSDAIVRPLPAHGRLAVADLPGGARGYARLRALAGTRAPGELLVVVQHSAPHSGNELLWAAVGGLGGEHTLTSQTTEQRGLIAAADLAPTILRHLELPIPAGARGHPVRTDGPLDSPYLRTLKARLGVIYRRRLPALACLLGAWGLLGLLALAWERARRVGVALRVGALALLWTPVAALLPAALEPSAAGEYALLVLGSFGLAALTDRLVPWPRAPILPALAALAALSVDTLAGTQLSIRSLLGPDPALGVRFYGIGNELKSALAVLVLAAVAAALYPSVRGRRAAGAMACAGVLLALVEGSARIGAGVGGVVLVSAATAVAAVLLLPTPAVPSPAGPSPAGPPPAAERPGATAGPPGSYRRRRALVVLLSPVAGLAALAALDLATAHGAGHYSASVLHAHSATDLWQILVRRYTAALRELRHGAMPIATAVALLTALFGVRRRRLLCAPVGDDPAWRAALAGGLTAGVVGALVEDSGPVLLLVAVFALGCVLAYLWGRPPAQDRPPAPPGLLTRRTDDITQRTGGTLRAARSRARTPPAAPAR